ncbi:MAG TPA: fimbria/pilus outer membrane usher protein [Luteibacter sp.]|uniref:fimbria/pilus outer membrane usher protein n=1 Tax=Luteibacter sp. TaxID=1886636 RepID=UPI002BBF9719|nr:fimbria/pilus outer membrane usher protein [Luteibacter sp.]HVI56689.1 fimbria/pilus outer membrane usher protein [Luteibacter sp.]
MNHLPTTIPRANGARMLARHPLVMALALALPGVAEAAIDPVEPDPSPAALDPQAVFNSDFIHSSAAGLDLSRFERGNVTLAGIYRPQIQVNGQPIPGGREVTFRQVADSTSAQPCFNRDMLVAFGLDMDKLETRGDSESRRQLDGSTLLCGHLDTAIPGATVDFDDADQILHVTLPQIFMASRARGYVSPDLWDEGEQAFMLNYNANTFQLRSDGRRSTSTFLGVNAGANLGGWRLRHNGALNVADGHRQWQNSLTYAQHDLTDARAQLTLGDSYTSGEILDSVRIRGVSIASDQRMLPASQRGYAPVIRGVAESNAQVTVRQNGYVIASTTVAPGAFELDDLYPTGYGSDLEVVITEADGRTKTIVVPYTSVPQMLRQGTTRFAVAAGQVSETSLAATPFILQATVQRGVTNSTTLYGGTTASNSYVAGLLGAAVNLPFGAVSLDVTGSRAAFRAAGTRRGVSTRLRYSRTVNATGTSIGIAAYRFSTRDYLGVTDAANLRERLRRGAPGDRIGGERSRFDVTVGQTIGGGRLVATGSSIGYWGSRSRGVNYSLGYGGSWRTLSYNVSVQRSRLGNAFGAGFGAGFGSANGRRDDGIDTTIYLALSVPLGSSPRSPNLNVSHNRTVGGYATAQASLTGALDSASDLTYNLSGSRSESTARSAIHGGNASLAYRTYAGTYRIGVGRTGGTSQYSLGTAGALVAHRDGLTLAQELGETNAIIHAPGAAGARIDSHSGARLDGRGNAVVRGLQPYQLNTVSINPKGASQDVELESTSESVAPRAGAFARLDYRTTVSRALLIQASRADGEPLPFGASVTDADGQVVGVVGQGSKIFTRGVAAGARLTVRWGEQSLSACHVDLPASLDTVDMHGMHRAVRATCVTSEAIGPQPLKKAA